MDPSITSTNTGVTPLVYSAEDIIAWTREEAYRMGEIGFSTNFPDTAANFNAWRCNVNAPLEPPIDEKAIEDAADAFHNDVMRIKARHELMQNMSTLVAEAHSIVDAKLLAAGGLKPGGDDRELRQKVVELFELEHPPAAANFVSVLVAQGPFSRLDELLKVNLPLKESLVGVDDLLKGAMELDARFQNPSGPKKEIKSGTWKYQVLYPDNLGGFQNIDQPSVRLQTDEDYRRMIQRMCDTSRQAFHAVLMQEHVLQKQANSDASNGKKLDGGKSGMDRSPDATMGEAEPEGDGDYEEPLDEDGNPYFDPVTPENYRKMMQAYNKKHKGMMDY